MLMANIQGHTSFAEDVCPSEQLFFTVDSDLFSAVTIVLFICSGEVQVLILDERMVRKIKSRCDSSTWCTHVVLTRPVLKKKNVVFVTGFLLSQCVGLSRWCVSVFVLSAWGVKATVLDAGVVNPSGQNKCCVVMFVLVTLEYTNDWKAGQCSVRTSSLLTLSVSRRKLCSLNRNAGTVDPQTVGLLEEKRWTRHAGMEAVACWLQRFTHRTIVQGVNSLNAWHCCMLNYSDQM